MYGQSNIGPRRPTTAPAQPARLGLVKITVRGRMNDRKKTDLPYRVWMLRKQTEPLMNAPMRNLGRLPNVLAVMLDLMRDMALRIEELEGRDDAES